MACASLVASRAIGDPNQVVLYNSGFTANIQQIIRTTVKRSLELTEDEFGIATFSEFPNRISDQRIRQLSSQKNKIQIYYSASFIAVDSDPSRKDFEMGFIGNALGLRVVVSTKDTLEKFNNIKSANQLRDFKIGVGTTWIEKDIFTAQRIPYEEAMLAENLLPMLMKKRFHYIAPSAIDDLNSFGITLNSELKVADKVMIYYPMPFYLHVASSNKQLADRVSLGLERFINNGEAQALINKIYKDQSLLQSKEVVNLLYIENPFFSKEKNQRSLQQLLQQAPQKFNLLRASD